MTNTVLEDVSEVPKELKAEMKGVNNQIHQLQEKLRMLRKEDGYADR
jgi:hypothetical protein